MDIIKVIPSATFLSVLKELQTCPGAPSSVKNYFARQKTMKKQSSNKQRRKHVSSDKDATENSIIDETKDDESRELLLLTSDVKWCHDKMRERGMSHRIHQLLNDSNVLLPKYSPPERSAELEARVERLRNQQANREYNDMTRNISQRQMARNVVTGIGQEMREMHREVNRQIITGVQYIISIVGTFFALFVGLSYAVPEFAPRLVIGVIGALIVAVAEIYFIIREDMREEWFKKVK